jgi:hypothetical protein
VSWRIQVLPTAIRLASRKVASVMVAARANYRAETCMIVRGGKAVY